MGKRHADTEDVVEEPELPLKQKKSKRKTSDAQAELDGTDDVVAKKVKKKSKAVDLLDAEPEVAVPKKEKKKKAIEAEVDEAEEAPKKKEKKKTTDVEAEVEEFEEPPKKKEKKKKNDVEAEVEEVDDAPKKKTKKNRTDVEADVDEVEEAPKKNKSKRKEVAEDEEGDEEDEDQEIKKRPKAKLSAEDATVDRGSEKVEDAAVDRGSDKPKKELTVFIGGIPWSCDAQTLKTDFSECGEIATLNMPMNEEGKPRGIAFITFKSKEAVDAALKYNGTDYGGRVLAVKLADERAGKGSTGKGKGGKGNSDFEVFIAGLPFETQQSVLRKDFEECGRIESMRMLVKEDGVTCRGVAFICFAEQSGVDKALEYNNTEYGGRWITVEKSGEGRGVNKDQGKGDKGGKGKGKKGKGKGKDKAKPEAGKGGGLKVEPAGVKKTFDSEEEDDEE